jgi:cobalt-zinc-cadmium resistance protein CzcA
MHFNVSSGVGFISLFGISIMGGVLFVSNFNHEVLEKKPMNMTEIEKILIRVAENQFRPRFMTISVAILGLLPAMFSSDIGSDIQRPMATVIVGGLLTTLIIGLYTTPMFCYLREMKKINNPDST